jgi:hypothetical protein
MDNNNKKKIGSNCDANEVLPLDLLQGLRKTTNVRTAGVLAVLTFKQPPPPKCMSNTLPLEHNTLGVAAMKLLSSGVCSMADDTYRLFYPEDGGSTFLENFTNSVSASRNFGLYVRVLLAEIHGVARDSIRNEGTREINYGIIYKKFYNLQRF